jgi:hypothetical protein
LISTLAGIAGSTAMLAMLALSLAACGSDAPGASGSSPTTSPAGLVAPTDPAPPVGPNLVTGEAAVGISAIQEAKAQLCDTERKTLEVAVEAYVAMNGDVPATEADLIPMLLRTEVTGYDLDAAGNVLPAPGSACV